MKSKNCLYSRKLLVGALSTNEEVLSVLSRDHTLPKIILEHLFLAKLKTTFTDKLPLMINPISGRVHTSYHHAVTATGRLSSSDHNLPFPVRHDNGRRIRRAFIASDGYCIMSAEYAQIALRIMAYLSKDAGLLKAFSCGIDIHCTTADEVFGVSVDKVTLEQRRETKVINFRLIYGISAFSLARKLGIAHREAKRYIECYFKRYPGILNYIKGTKQQASDRVLLQL